MNGSERPRRRLRQILTLVVGLAVSALFIWLTFRKIRVDDLLETIAGVGVGWLALSQLTKLGGFCCMTARSRILLRPVHDFGFWQMFKSILVAFAGNVVLPFRAGDVLRAGYLSRHGEAETASYLGVIAFEKLLDSLLLLIVFILVVPSLIGAPAASASIPALAAGLVLALTVVLGVSLYPDKFVIVVERLSTLLGDKISGFVSGRARAFAAGVSAVSSPKTLIAVTLITAMYWTFGAGSVALWLEAFELELPWYAPLVVLSLTAFGTALPASPGFVGTYHYFCALALTLLGVSAATAAAFALVGHATAMVPAALLSVVVLLLDWYRATNESNPKSRHT